MPPTFRPLRPGFKIRSKARLPQGGGFLPQFLPARTFPQLSPAGTHRPSPVPAALPPRHLGGRAGHGGAGGSAASEPRGLSQAAAGRGRGCGSEGAAEGREERGPGPDGEMLSPKRPGCPPPAGTRREAAGVGVAQLRGCSPCFPPSPCSRAGGEEAWRAGPGQALLAASPRCSLRRLRPGPSTKRRGRGRAARGRGSAQRPGPDSHPPGERARARPEPPGRAGACSARGRGRRPRAGPPHSPEGAGVGCAAPLQAA